MECEEEGLGDVRVDRSAEQDEERIDDANSCDGGEGCISRRLR